jgi:hypothetical protein
VARLCPGQRSGVLSMSATGCLDMWPAICVSSLTLLNQRTGAAPHENAHPCH